MNLFTDYDLNEHDLTHNNMLLGPSFDSSKISCGCVHTLPLRLYVCAMCVCSVLIHRERQINRNRKHSRFKEKKNAKNLF